MKKTIYTLLAAWGFAFTAFAQTPDSVRLGASYVNQVWYSLANGPVGTAQSKDNWDLAFEISGFTASILANTQKNNFALYKAPYKALAYGSLDTSGIASWPLLYNSDASWGLGAFSRTANPANEFDLGWGVYDMSTHFVTGDSCYVLKIGSVYRKLVIDNLANGSYNFTYGNVDGSHDTSVAIAKADYKGKNFAYYDLVGNKAIDREPVSAAWDFTFVKYTAQLDMGGGATMPYGVTGILQNTGVTVAQVDGVEDIASYVDTTGKNFNTAINEIGYDWKSFDMSTYTYVIKPKQLFFVKDKAGKYWKVVFTGFASTTGQFSFTKEPLNGLATALDNITGITGKFGIYPNPAVGDQVYVLFDTQASVQNVQLRISDAQGNVLFAGDVNAGNGFQGQEVSVAQLKSGIYFATLNLNGKNYTQKFIKQ